MQLYYIFFIQVSFGGHWVIVGCCNGARYKKVETHYGLVQ